MITAVNKMTRCAPGPLNPAAPAFAAFPHAAIVPAGLKRKFLPAGWASNQSTLKKTAYNTRMLTGAEFTMWLPEARIQRNNLWKQAGKTATGK